MQRTEFSYHLPEDLIAQAPLAERSASRMLCLDGSTGAMEHRTFRELPELLTDKDLLVFNDTRVMPARMFAAKATGGRVEILIERLTGEHSALVHLRSNKKLREGTRLYLATDEHAAVTDAWVDLGPRQEPLYTISSDQALGPLLARFGHMPLPPYIERADEPADRERYQTVYARREGAVAAPTAGLHFDEALLGQITDLGVKQAHVTLHVGAGTFQPVRADDIRDHDMHREYLEVNQAACDAVNDARARGGRVIAVGTTAVRSLETASANGDIAPYTGETQLFIYPGYRFRSVDCMITNFHLPESTLLMLVSAFSGKEAILAAYDEAVRERYRFFSYGDAMFLQPRVGAR